eukprot:COSAG01_NODE_5923_length_3949_cov_100.549091_4_plen_213_part_01
MGTSGRTATATSTSHATARIGATDAGTKSAGATSGLLSLSEPLLTPPPKLRDNGAGSGPAPQNLLCSISINAAPNASVPTTGTTIGISTLYPSPSKITIEVLEEGKLAGPPGFYVSVGGTMPPPPGAAEPEPAAEAAGADTDAVPAGVTFFFDGEPMAGKADKIEAMFAADAQLSFIGAYAPPMPPPGFLDLEHIKVSAGGLPPPLLRASTAP